MGSLAGTNFPVQGVKATGPNPHQHSPGTRHWPGQSGQTERCIYCIHNQSLHIGHVGDLASLKNEPIIRSRTHADKTLKSYSAHAWLA